MAKIAAQIAELARENMELLEQVQYGEVVFFVQKGDVWRMEIKISVKKEEIKNGKVEKLVR